MDKDLSKDQIPVIISIWEESLKRFEIEYADAEKYDDYGTRMHIEEMLIYCQRRINELEMMLLNKGA